MHKTIRGKMKKTALVAAASFTIMSFMSAGTAQAAGNEYKVALTVKTKKGTSPAGRFHGILVKDFIHEDVVADSHDLNVPRGDEERTVRFIYHTPKELTDEARAGVEYDGNSWEVEYASAKIWKNNQQWLNCRRDEGVLTQGKNLIIHCDN